MVSVLSYFTIVVMSAIYYGLLFWELCDYMTLPMFTQAINVYVDGVYDLCHVGHHNIFTNALKFGNRLVVGVLSDADVESYKRRPIMSLDERCAVVSTCKGVSKVIRGCPYPGIPESFIKEHNIHIVCHSPEYDKEDDKYYAIPRAMGITKVLPRTEGVSTSQLIKRVKQYGEDSKQVF